MFKSIAIFTSFVLLALSLSGCAVLLGAAAGGAGTAVWLSGKLSDELKAPYEKSIEATKKALSSMNMEVTKETKKDDIAQIMSKYADGATTWIDIRPLTSDTTKIEVRVGATGNKGAE